MALDVNVTIKLSGVAGTVGFGVPLILISKAASNIEYAEYSDLDELPDAGFAETSTAYKLFRIMKMQNNKPESVAVAQTTKKAAEALEDYKGKVRQVITVLGESGDSTMKQVADYVETTDSMTYFPVVATAEAMADFEGLDRTMVGVHSDTTQALAAGMVGATAGMAAGSFTYKNIIVKGVTPDDLSDGSVKTIDNEAGTGVAYGYTLQRKAGDIVTTEGKAASGEFMDIVDSFDWIIQNIGYRSQKALNSEPKLPYDNRGIGMLEAATNSVLKDADNMGIIAHDEADVPVYETNFGTRAEASAADRADRAYKLGRFSFELAGAIHTAAINGTVTV